MTIETYVPLYRKYRPQAFSDLVGQAIVSKALSRALELNKVAHAYLLCGPRGTGKTSSARILAKSLNCANGPTPTPCQQCPSCVGITDGQALDVTELDAASNNGVDDIRDITDKVQFSPMQGKYRIFIIDEVHMLSTAAFNALLKTLEEPPPNVVFIFATTEPHKVLPTIVSRCQRFDFSRITREHIEERLRYVAEQEGIAIDSAAVTLIARHAKGGMRDALGLLDQVSVLGRGQADFVITTELVFTFIGQLEEQVLHQMAQAFIDVNPANVLVTLSDLQNRGVEPGQVVKALIGYFRNVLIAKACQGQNVAETLDLPEDTVVRLVNVAEAFSMEELPQILQRLANMEYQLKTSSEPALWLEVGLLDICFRESVFTLAQLSERIEALETRLANGPVATTPQKSSVPVSTPRAIAPSTPSAGSMQSSRPTVQSTMLAAAKGSGGEHQAMWQEILKAIQHAPTRALLKDHCHLVSWEPPAMRLVFTSDINYGIFKRSQDKVNHLQTAITQVAGQAVDLAIDVDKQFKMENVALVQSTSVNRVPEVPPQTPRETPPHPEPVSELEPQVAAVAVIVRPEDNSSTAEELSPIPVVSTSVDDAEGDMLREAKQMTQQILQAKLLDS